MNGNNPLTMEVSTRTTKDHMEHTNHGTCSALLIASVPSGPRCMGANTCSDTQRVMVETTTCHSFTSCLVPQAYLHLCSGIKPQPSHGRNQLSRHHLPQAHHPDSIALVTGTAEPTQHTHVQRWAPLAQTPASEHPPTGTPHDQPWQPTPPRPSLRATEPQQVITRAATVVLGAVRPHPSEVPLAVSQWFGAAWHSPQRRTQLDRRQGWDVRASGHVAVAAVPIPRPQPTRVHPRKVATGAC